MTITLHHSCNPSLASHLAILGLHVVILSCNSQIFSLFFWWWFENSAISMWWHSYPCISVCGHATITRVFPLHINLSREGIGQEFGNVPVNDSFPLKACELCSFSIKRSPQWMQYSKGINSQQRRRVNSAGQREMNSLTNKRDSTCEGLSCLGAEIPWW